MSTTCKVSIPCIAYYHYLAGLLSRYLSLPFGGLPIAPIPHYHCLARVYQVKPSFSLLCHFNFKPLLSLPHSQSVICLSPLLSLPRRSFPEFLVMYLCYIFISIVCIAVILRVVALRYPLLSLPHSQSL